MKTPERLKADLVRMIEKWARAYLKRYLRGMRKFMLKMRNPRMPSKLVQQMRRGDWPSLR